MKHYKIYYLEVGQSLSSYLYQVVVAKSQDEKRSVIERLESEGYYIIDVQAFRPIPYEEQFYA